MNPSRKIWLFALYVITLLTAIILWVILYARGIVFHFAGVYVAPGIVVLAGMILADGLIFFLLSI